MGSDWENGAGCFARLLLAPLLVGACAGEPRVLAPRTPPPRVMPNVAMPASPVPVQHGRVVLDVVDGPMRVAAKYDPSFVPPGGAPETARSGELCTTPCVVDLPSGRYRLYLSATAATDPGTGDVDDLVLGDGTYVDRRAPGRYQTPSIYNQIAPGALIVLGLTGMVVGAALLSNDDTRVPGGLVLGAGVAASVGGGIWQGCEAKCRGQGMELAGMVYMGEYSDACVCSLPGKAASLDQELLAVAPAVAGGSAGVVMQMQRQQEQQQQSY